MFSLLRLYCSILYQSMVKAFYRQISKEIHDKSFVRPFSDQLLLSSFFLHYINESERKYCPFLKIIIITM